MIDMERRLAKEGDYEITLLWLPGKESEAKVCIFFGGSLFEDSKVCGTCKHFDIERDGYECDNYGIAESIWSCKMWEVEE